MAMKIYKIVADHSYWSLMAVDRDFWKTTLKTYKELFALEPMRSEWMAPAFYVRDPARTKRGSFHHLVSGVLAYCHDVCDSDLGEIIEHSGEILPAEFDGTGERCHIFNCTTCYNCLDRSNTQMRMTPDGVVAIEVHKYAFHVDRIGDCNLFKIPETKSVGLYALAGRDEAEDEFYAQYHALGFTGLKFEEVWSDGGY